MDVEPMPNTRSYHTEPTKPLTTFYGHTKPTTISESQTALATSKRVQKGMCQHTQSSRMIYTMIHFKDHLLQSSKHKDL